MAVHRATILFLLFAVLWQPVFGQDAPEHTVIARFQEAAALDVDPTGRLYVADAGRDVVRILDREGRNEATLGGSGTRESEFDTPVDLDPTNGLTLLVADAGNGRIQRFSAELQYLETMPVGLSFGGEQDRRVFDDGRDGSAIRGSGRPIAVTSSDSDETFVINDREDVVVKFDDRRRSERIIRGAGGWGGALRRPVALEVDGSRRLYVADGEDGRVLVYDLFGSFMNELSVSLQSDIRALSMSRRRLLIVCMEEVVVWNPKMETVTRHPIEVDGPLVDAAQQGGEVFLLTERRLLRQNGW